MTTDGKRWSVDDERNHPVMLVWPDGYGYITLDLSTGSLKIEVETDGDEAVAFAALVADVRDAARLRSLAAWFADHPGDPFSGAKVAGMLNEANA